MQQQTRTNDLYNIQTSKSILFLSTWNCKKVKFGLSTSYQICVAKDIVETFYVSSWGKEETRRRVGPL